MTYKLKTAAQEFEFDDLSQLRLWFSKSSWPRNTWMLNFVTNSSADTVDSNGSSRGLSNEVDLQALIGYRLQAQAVLTTAKTARAEQYRSTSGKPLVLISRTGNFDDIPAVFSDIRVILVTSKTHATLCRAKYSRKNLSVLAPRKLSASSIRKALARRGLRKVIVEAGLDFAQQLVDQQQVEYLALSVVSAAASEGAATELFLGGLRAHDAKQVFRATCENVVFTRFEL